MALSLGLGLLACGGAHAQSCPWDPQLVSAAAKPVTPQAIERLPPDLNVKEIVARLGPAAREVGSGVYVLRWDLTNGQMFSVSATSPCALPMARGLLKKN